jgi:hypothetical protein
MLQLKPGTTYVARVLAEQAPAQPTEDVANSRATNKTAFFIGVLLFSGLFISLREY